MSYVRLSEIPRTISFRTALMFLALFGCSFFALFGYIYWQTTGYLISEVDTALHREVDRQNAQEPALRRTEILKHTGTRPRRAAPIYAIRFCWYNDCGGAINPAYVQCIR